MMCAAGIFESQGCREDRTCWIVLGVERVLGLVGGQAWRLVCDSITLARLREKITGVL